MLIENTHWLDLVMDESEYWPVSGEKNETISRSFAKLGAISYRVFQHKY
jgi:hypothetical protein